MAAGTSEGATGVGEVHVKPDKLSLLKGKKNKINKDLHKECGFGKSPPKDGGTIQLADDRSTKTRQKLCVSASMCQMSCVTRWSHSSVRKRWTVAKR